MIQFIPPPLKLDKYVDILNSESLLNQKLCVSTIMKVSGSLKRKLYSQAVLVWFIGQKKVQLYAGRGGDRTAKASMNLCRMASLTICLMKNYKTYVIGVLSLSER